MPDFSIQLLKIIIQTILLTIYRECKWCGWECKKIIRSYFAIRIFEIQFAPYQSSAKFNQLQKRRRRRFSTRNLLCIFFYFFNAIFQEAEAFAKAFDINSTDLKEVALKIASMPKFNESRKRVVVITQGCEPVILVENGEITLIPVNALSREQIVDTNGAGDAFAGGFLSQMVLGAPYKTAVKCGIYSATHIIQHSGCTFSGESDFSDS